MMDGSTAEARTRAILDPLTPAQREAVSHVDGPMLILAGPGSGKTRVVTHRMAFLLLQGISPAQIVALTFTNKAADEMRVRLQRLAPGQSVWVSTFHRFCSRLLRRHASLVGLDENFTIYDTEDSQRALLDVVQRADLQLTHVTPGQIAQEISRAKSNLITAEQFTPSLGQSLGVLIQDIYPEYQRRLLACNAVDFDDLLLYTALLLRQNPELRRILDARFRYILVDEYQDTNFAQYAIVRALSCDYPNLAVTGDPDQSIYGWRGANLENILGFERDYPEVRVVRLEQNYRSTRRILRVADYLIEHNRQRKPKTLYTDNSEGRAVRLVEYPTSRDEAEQIAGQIAEMTQSGQRSPRDVAVFYRVNSLSRLFETALRAAGVSYQVVNGVEFYQRKEVKDVLAYLHLINNPRNDMALLRVINTPPRKIGKTTIRRLVDHARQHRQSLVEAARQAGLIGALTKRAAVHVAEFVALFDRLSLHAAAPLEEIMGQVLEATGYEQWLRDSGDDDDKERLTNIAELLNAARDFDERHSGDHPLQEFLEQTSLVNDTDDWEQQREKVSLMTLHAAKGLEFPVVYIVAIEHGLLPHERSQQELRELEEERRLLFVGITRCREELQLSYARRRMLRGGDYPTITSEFLMELPREEMEIIQPAPISMGEDDSASVVPWEVDSYDACLDVDVDVEAEEISPKPRRQRNVAPVRLMTAAEMLPQSAESVARIAPEQFRQGMFVTHPEHGPGRIVALSGTGSRRVATVQFFNESEQTKFTLLHSNLQPVIALCKENGP